MKHDSRSASEHSPHNFFDLMKFILQCSPKRIRSRVASPARLGRDHVRAKQLCFLGMKFIGLQFQPYIMKMKMQQVMPVANPMILTAEEKGDRVNFSSHF